MTRRARAGARARRCRSTTRVAMLLPPARGPGLVELRDPARQRHRLLRRAGAAAAARRRRRRRLSRRRWRARASTSTRTRTSRAWRSARWRARSSMARPPERIERFRTALCGPLGSVGDRLVWASWLPFCSLRRARRVRAGRVAARRRSLTFLGLYNAGHLGAARLGAAASAGARARRRAGARQPGAAARAAAHRHGRRRARRASRCRSRSHRIIGPGQRPARRRRWSASLLGAIAARAAARPRRGMEDLARRPHALSPSTRWSDDGRTHRADREQERAARAARGRDREGGGEVPERDHDSCATTSR